MVFVRPPGQYGNPGISGSLMTKPGPAAGRFQKNA